MPCIYSVYLVIFMSGIFVLFCIKLIFLQESSCSLENISFTELQSLFLSTRITQSCLRIRGWRGMLIRINP